MGQKFNSGRDGQPRQHHGEEIIGHAENMDDLLASDAFLTDLSRGVDPVSYTHLTLPTILLV